MNPLALHAGIALNAAVPLRLAARSAFPFGIAPDLEKPLS